MIRACVHLTSIEWVEDEKQRSAAGTLPHASSLLELVDEEILRVAMFAPPLVLRFKPLISIHLERSVGRLFRFSATNLNSRSELV